MRRKNTSSKDFLLLVALYANLFFGYQYIQMHGEENRKTEILIQELKQSRNDKYSYKSIS